MSELRDLPDLAGDVRERVVIPPYAEVSRRVRARRLRGAVGAMAAAVLVVGGVAVWQSVATTAGPSIPQPAGTTQGPIPPTDESQWRAVVDGTDSHPFEIAGHRRRLDRRGLAGPGDPEHRRSRWSSARPTAPCTGCASTSRSTLTPVPGGWVGMDGARGHLIGSDGSWTDLGETAAPGEPRAGDVVVTGQYSQLAVLARRPELSAMPALEGALRMAYVTPTGDMITCSTTGTATSGSRCDDVHSPWIDGSTCVLAGRGDAVERDRPGRRARRRDPADRDAA